jgi:hypothetical protein
MNINVFSKSFFWGWGMEFEPRALHLLDSTLHFCLFVLAFGFSYFSGRVLHFCPRPASDCNPTYASHKAGVTGTYHHAQLID